MFLREKYTGNNASFIFPPFVPKEDQREVRFKPVTKSKMIQEKTGFQGLPFHLFHLYLAQRLSFYLPFLWYHKG